MSSSLRASGTLLVAACVLTGCATQQPQKAAASPVQASTDKATPAAESVVAPLTHGGPSVIDQRPQSDKVFEMHSLWITSCDYGIFTLAEKKSSKSHIEALRDDLASLPGDPWHGHAITVTHYAAYLNAKQTLKKGLSAVSSGLIPSMMSQMGEKCAATQMHGGWYAATDLKTTVPPIVIEIVATLDGKPHSFRSVYSPETDVTPKLKKPSDDVQLAEAIKKADLEFAASLGEDDAVPPAAGGTGSTPDGVPLKP
ncbi:MAG: hypothetical protein WAM90_13890 [Rhodanobacter sp.]